MGNDSSKEQPQSRQINVNELKTYIMIVQAKLTQSRNKKIAEIKKKQDEAVKNLQDNNYEIGKLKIESVMRCEDYISAFDILSVICEVLKEKVSYINLSAQVPDDLRASLDTIVFASSRLEIDELHKLRELLKTKFGSLYIQEANENRQNLVNVNIVKKLSVSPYPQHIIVARLKVLASDHDMELNLPEEIMNPIADMSNPFADQGMQGVVNNDNNLMSPSLNVNNNVQGGNNYNNNYNNNGSQNDNFQINNNNYNNQGYNPNSNLNNYGNFNNNGNYAQQQGYNPNNNVENPYGNMNLAGNYPNMQEQSTPKYNSDVHYQQFNHQGQTQGNDNNPYPK